MKGKSFAKREAFFFCSVDGICSGQSSEFVGWTAIDKENIFYVYEFDVELLNENKILSKNIDELDAAVQKTVKDIREEGYIIIVKKELKV